MVKANVLTGLIPRYAPVKAVAAYLRIASVPIPERIRQKHLAINRNQWEKVKPSAMKGKYIEHQRLLTGMRFGNAKAGFNCCEAIAAYNVMAALGDPKRHPADGRDGARASYGFPEVLEECESLGLVLGGFFGTSTDHIVRFLKGHGFMVKELWGRKITGSAAEALAGSYSAFVLTMYNDRDNIFAQVHTVCITRESGLYTVHNAGICDKRFHRLHDAVRESHAGQGKEILLLGVKR